MAKKGDKDLYKRLRKLGMRKRRAREVTKALESGDGKAPKAARRAIADLTGAAAELKDRIDKGPQKRKKAAQKAARTRSKNAKKRSEAAKKGARTRAKSGS